MELRFTPMSLSDAESISTWKYPPPYDFYDVGEDLDLALWISDSGEEGRYSGYLGDELAGYLSFGADARVRGGVYPAIALDTGLGMKPDMTGRGYGRHFVEAGTEFARREFAPTGFRLTVAAFNERAMKVYRRSCFEETRSFLHPETGVRFIQMERAA